MRLSLALLATVSALGPVAADPPAPLVDWTPSPVGWKGAQVKDAVATMTADKWSYLLAPTAPLDVELTATVTVREPGKLKTFFGESWSVWPDKTFGDQGWDACLL